MRVKAGPDTHYWRVSVLNTVKDGTWFEEISPQFGDPPVPLAQEGLVPPRELRQSDWEEQHVTIEALRDQRLPGGSVPVRFAPGNAIGSVSYDPAGVAIAEDVRSRAATPTTSGATRPSPTPAQLAASKPIYSGPILAPEEEYREVEPGVYPRLFGTPGRAGYSHYLMTSFARADQLRPFARLEALAEERGRRRAQPVRRGGRARAVVPLRRRLRLRPASAQDARRGRSARRLRRAHEARLLPALRRRDGADAPLPRDPVARRRRVRKRELPARRVGGLRPRRAHVGRGLVPRLGLGAVRPDAGARRPRGLVLGLFAELRRQRLRPPSSPGGTASRAFGNTLANTLGFGTKARTSPDVPQLGGVCGRGGPDEPSPVATGGSCACWPWRSRARSSCSCWRSCCGAARAS